MQIFTPIETTSHLRPLQEVGFPKRFPSTCMTPVVIEQGGSCSERLITTNLADQGHSLIGTTFVTQFPDVFQSQFLKLKKKKKDLENLKANQY